MRRLLDAPSSQIIDQALAALIDRVETARELAALAALPYEDDADLSWDAPAVPGLAYEGQVPPEVQRLARQRRERPAGT